MPAGYDNADKLELEVNELLQNQLKRIEGTAFSMTKEEAAQFEADREMLNALIEKLVRLRSARLTFPEERSHP